MGTYTVANGEALLADVALGPLTAALNYARDRGISHVAFETMAGNEEPSSALSPGPQTFPSGGSSGGGGQRVVQVATLTIYPE